MENKSKKIKRIMVYISGLIAISITALFIWASPTIPIAFGKDYPFEEDYNLYKGYADTYIKTWDRDTIEDKLLNISQDISEDSITITVDGTVSKIVAQYPIKFVPESNDNPSIIISFEDASYENHSNVPSILECVSFLILSGVLFTGVFYCIIGIIHEIINFIIIEIEKKRK